MHKTGGNDVRLTKELERARVAMCITKLPDYVESIDVKKVVESVELEGDKEATIEIRHRVGNKAHKYLKKFLLPHDAVIEHGSLNLDHINHPEGWRLRGTTKNGEPFVRMGN